QGTAAGVVGSDAAEHGDDLAVDRHVGGVELHGGEAGIGRQESDLAPTAPVGLHGGLVAGDAGHDDVAVLGRRLGPAHDVVAVDDGGLDHGVAAHPQHEQVAVAGEV